MRTERFKKEATYLKVIEHLCCHVSTGILIDLELDLQWIIGRTYNEDAVKKIIQITKAELQERNKLLNFKK